MTGNKHPKWKGGYENVLRLGRARRARKKGAEGSHTTAEWLALKERYNFTCPCCGKSEPGILLTEDHIQPLSKGGGDNIENIQPLCVSCNSKKKTRTVRYEPIAA